MLAARLDLAGIRLWSMIWPFGVPTGRLIDEHQSNHENSTDQCQRGLGEVHDIVGGLSEDSECGRRRHSVQTLVRVGQKTHKTICHSST